MTIKVSNELTFDRSDPDAVVCHRRNESGGWTQVTRLEDLRSGSCSRTDIGMVNYTVAHCGTCTCDEMDHGQALVFANADGTLFGRGLEYMSQRGINECLAIAARLVAVAKVHPEFNVYFNAR